MHPYTQHTPEPAEARWQRFQQARLAHQLNVQEARALGLPDQVIEENEKAIAEYDLALAVLADDIPEPDRPDFDHVGHIRAALAQIEAAHEQAMFECKMELKRDIPDDEKAERVAACEQVIADHEARIAMLEAELEAAEAER